MKKKTAAFVLSFLLLKSMALAQDATVPQIIITEIAAAEPSETEWIEIYNKGNAGIDLTGWKFFEDSINHGLSVTQGDAVLDPSEFAVIVNKTDEFKQKYPDFTGTIFDSNWSSLKTEGEEIGLKDANGNVIELFTYPAAENTSLERIDINILANDAANWASHPLSHSLGRLWEEPQSTVLPPPEPPPVPIPEATPPPPLPPAPAPPAPLPPPPPPPPPPPLPQNLPPTAVIQIQSGNLIAYESTSINFDGRASYDPDGNSLSFLWDFGDGNVDSSANPGIHTFRQPGNYSVTLTVIDPAGAQHRAAQFVQVLAPPEAPRLPPAPPAPPTPPPPAAPQTAPPGTPLLIQSQPSGFATSSPTISNFPISSVTLRGYFVFVPYEEGSGIRDQGSVKNKKKKTKKKTPTAKKSKKTAPKNGDLSTSILITEIFPVPSDDEEEWIEITNQGKTAVNLGNWQLADAKKKTPYRFPDSLELLPGEYTVFPKSETKISLNNDTDRLTLADFNGSKIHEVTYENGERGKSYARIFVQPEKADLVASQEPLPMRHTAEWQWLTDPTPGQPNPTLQNLHGKVSRFLANGEVEVLLQNGDSKTVTIPEETLEGSLAQTLLREGAELDFQAAEGSDGFYKLQKINRLVLPEKAPEERKDFSPFFLLGAFIFMCIGLFLNALPAIRATKEWIAKLREG